MTPEDGAVIPARRSVPGCQCGGRRAGGGFGAYVHAASCDQQHPTTEHCNTGATTAQSSSTGVRGSAPTGGDCGAAAPSSAADRRAAPSTTHPRKDNTPVTRLTSDLFISDDTLVEAHHHTVTDANPYGCTVLRFHVNGGSLTLFVESDDALQRLIDEAVKLQRIRDDIAAKVEAAA